MSIAHLFIQVKSFNGRCTMAEQKTDQQADVARKRSPNFPYSSVRDCVGYITRLYGEVQQRKVPVVVAFGHMGMSPKSSSSDRVRASLSSYKLTQESIVNNEKRIQLTDLGYQIVVDTRESKRLARYREAALNDPMMKKIWENVWKRGLPNSDAEIISTLRGDYKFQEEAAKRFTTVLKDNYEFCQLATYYEDDSEAADSIEAPPLDRSQGILPGMEKPPKSPTTHEGTKQFPIPLDDGRFAYIDLPLVVTDDDATYIPKFVEMLLEKTKRIRNTNEQEERPKENNQ
jgi:hypothetical protein